ncbi:MAG: ABC transporter permease [Gammaproteobacteria bacterium]|nr:ABC transporter permease [Gammaproteobacteria bacterium]
MFRQTINITTMNLRSVLSRKGSSSIIVVGIAGVVAVVVGLLAMSEGIRSALRETSHPDRVLVMRTGTQDEITGWLSAAEVNVLKGVDGIGTVSGELVVVVDLVTRETGKPGVAVARGVEASAFELRPDWKVVAGRPFQPGKNELLAGVNASDTYAGLDVGSQVNVRDALWEVVGHFDAGGRAHDSEVWMDLPIAQAAFRRDGVVSTARAMLDVGSDAALVGERIRQEPRLRADLVFERDFYARQSEAKTGMVETFAYLIGAIMGLGAVIASVNTMYSSVSTRSVEIGTLRALGFSNVPVVVSVMVEAVLLALAGGLLGGAVVYVLYDGLVSSTLNVGSMSQVAFEFAVTPRLLLIGLGSALSLGAIGGLLPALRAARLPVVAALRSG